MRKRKTSINNKQFEKKIHINEELPILHFDIWVYIMSFIDITDIKTLLKFLIVSRNSYLYIEKHIKNLLYPIIQYRKYKIGPRKAKYIPFFSIEVEDEDEEHEEEEKCRQMEFSFDRKFRDLDILYNLLNPLKFNIDFESFYKFSDLSNIKIFMKFIIGELYDDTNYISIDKFFLMIEYINKKSFNKCNTLKIIYICSLILSILNLSLKHYKYKIRSNGGIIRPDSHTKLKYIFHIDNNIITPLYKLIDKIKVIDEYSFNQKIESFKDIELYNKDTALYCIKYKILEPIYLKYITRFDSEEQNNKLKLLVYNKYEPDFKQYSNMINVMINDSYIELKNPKMDDRLKSVVLIDKECKYIYDHDIPFFYKCFENTLILDNINIYYHLQKNYYDHLDKIYNIVNLYYDNYFDNNNKTNPYPSIIQKQEQQ
jgi:hypothetical protein